MKILQLDHISKLYRLGEFGVGTLGEDLNRLWARIRGKEDPTLTISEQNIRSQDQAKYIWAIRDISFSLTQGETLGIIGKNGAGKSTLLGIISKITRPTHGAVYLNGSISSILQIGTGFNTVLTGRENVYMSGVILGMSRSQINRYFDDIVEFSGLRRFIDTPVSRYSSGMYLRLAFSIAAHLQSDILILDEVLAVGDYEFRNKALDHIQKLAQSNRTIIYVAHQLETIRRVCSKVLLIEQGRMKAIGDTDKMLKIYTKEQLHTTAVYELERPLNNTKGHVDRISILDATDRPSAELTLGEIWKVKVDFTVNEDLKCFNIMLNTTSPLGEIVNVTQLSADHLRPGRYAAIFEAKGFHLGIGSYLVSVSLATQLETFESLREAAVLNIAPTRKENTIFVEPQALIASPLEAHMVTLN